MSGMLETIGIFFDPLAFLLVAVGAFLLAIVQRGGSDMRRGVAALKPALFADPVKDAASALHLAGRIEEVAQMRGLSCADRVRTTGPFLNAACEELADARVPETFDHWVEQDLVARAERHRAASGFWSAVADNAPALGMAGTIIGLVRMFSAMNDPSHIGPAMALALLTTFYGVILSSIIAGPIAARLERFSEIELGWQRALTSRMSEVAHRELAPRVVEHIREVRG